jgi:hypothetical protein
VMYRKKVHFIAIGGAKGSWLQAAMVKPRPLQ